MHELLPGSHVGSRGRKGGGALLASGVGERGREGHARDGGGAREGGRTKNRAGTGGGYFRDMTAEPKIAARVSWG